jgi:hypothetical protein
MTAPQKEGFTAPALEAGLANPASMIDPLNQRNDAL